MLHHGDDARAWWSDESVDMEAWRPRGVCDSYELMRENTSRVGVGRAGLEVRAAGVMGAAGVVVEEAQDNKDNSLRGGKR